MGADRGTMMRVACAALVVLALAGQAFAQNYACLVAFKVDPKLSQVRRQTRLGCEKSVAPVPIIGNTITQ